MARAAPGSLAQSCPTVLLAWRDERRAGAGDIPWHVRREYGGGRPGVRIHRAEPLGGVVRGDDDRVLSRRAAALLLQAARGGRERAVCAAPALVAAAR